MPEPYGCSPRHWCCWHPYPCPFSGTDVSIANRAVLLLMHVGVAAVLIPAFYRTSNPFHPAGAGHGVGQASTG